MKYRWLLLFVSLLFLNCPKRISPGSRQVIDLYYIGSLTKDIEQPEPLLSGIAELKGLKIGYLDTDKPGFALFLERIGLYRLANDLPLDFIVTNFPVYDQEHLPVLKTMGYGIKNIGGIRFAVLSLGKDSLTIHEQTRISLARERSDVLWVIEKKILDQPPFKMSFMVSNRVLQNTGLGKIKNKPDPERVKNIAAFTRLLEDTLSAQIDLAGQPLAEYALKKMSLRTGAGVILYPASLILNPIPRTPFTVRDLLENIDGSLRFVKKEITRDSLLKDQQENNYLLWGKMGKTNTVLVPGPGGDYVLDLLLN
jgi:hypothetical protein